MTLIEELRSVEGRGDASYKKREVLEQWRAHPLIHDAVQGKKSLPDAVAELFRMYGGERALYGFQIKNTHYEERLAQTRVSELFPIDEIHSQTQSGPQDIQLGLYTNPVERGIMRFVFSRAGCRALNATINYVTNPIGTSLLIGALFALIDQGKAPFDHEPLTNYATAFCGGAVVGGLYGVFLTPLHKYAGFQRASRAAQEIQTELERFGLVAAVQNTA